MNQNILKRRRPHAQQDEHDSFIVSTQLSSPPILQRSEDFDFLEPHEQQTLDHLASQYYLRGFQLHQLAVQAYYDSYFQPSKRHRPLLDVPMSSHFPGNSLQESPEKSQAAGHYGHQRLAGMDAGPSSSALQGPGLASGLAEGLANIFGCCQNCFAPGAIHIPDGYQLIPAPSTFDYGATNGYEVEKRPSADVSQQEAYIPPTTVASNGTNFPNEGPEMMSNYVANFQSVQESPGHGMPAPPVVPDNLVYATDIPEGSYYSNAPNTSGPDDSQNLSNVNSHSANHPAPAVDLMSAPFDGTFVGPPLPPTLQHQRDMASLSSGCQYMPQEMEVKGEDVGHSAAGARLDIVYSHQRPPASKRGPFKDIKQRQETANTRKTGSCMRCKLQRIRCIPDPEDPSGGCMTCKPKANSNHKHINRMPCMRVKITDVKCFKPGQVHGYEWTLRWAENGPLDNIANWASSEVKTIRVTEGYTHGMSVELHVRQFVPQNGDKLERSWYTPEGVKKSVPIPPYAITDLDEAQSAYQEYIRRGVVECFNSVIQGVMGVRDRLLFETYRMTWQLSQDPRISAEERELLTQTLELWVAVRLTTKSVEIVGNETLGMDRGILDKTSPQHGRIPLPPVMGAQLDLVLIQQIQTRLRREMLEKLSKMVHANKPRTWLTTYLVTFILLHNIALLTNHDASYAKKHGMKTRFAREAEVREYHRGGVILLSYFHYCNKGTVPFTEECREQDLRQLAQLDEQAVRFVQWTRAQVMEHKREWDGMNAQAYDQPYFFVSQLFQREWQPADWVC